MLKETSQSPADHLHTDSNSHSVGEGDTVKTRMLKPWVSDSDVADAEGNNWSLSSDGSSSSSWDQFSTNERLFGVTSSYSEELYTTRLDRNSPAYLSRLQHAQKVAKEIELLPATSWHEAEERGQALDGTVPDEEDRYGAVVRTPSKHGDHGIRNGGDLTIQCKEDVRGDTALWSRPRKEEMDDSLQESPQGSTGREPRRRRRHSYPKAPPRLRRKRADEERPREQSTEADAPVAANLDSCSCSSNDDTKRSGTLPLPEHRSSPPSPSRDMTFCGLEGRSFGPVRNLPRALPPLGPLPPNCNSEMSTYSHLATYDPHHARTPHNSPVIPFAHTSPELSNYDPPLLSDYPVNSTPAPFSVDLLHCSSPPFQTPPVYTNEAYRPYPQPYSSPRTSISSQLEFPFPSSSDVNMLLRSSPSPSATTMLPATQNLHPSQNSSPSSATHSPPSTPSDSENVRPRRLSRDEDELEPSTWFALRMREISDYAQYLGMHPVYDADFLWIAEKALMAPLPEGWTEHRDENNNIYYYDQRNGISSWEHPFDSLYRSLFLKLKEKRTLLSRVTPSSSTMNGLPALPTLSRSTSDQLFAIPPNVSQQQKSRIAPLKQSPRGSAPKSQFVAPGEAIGAKRAKVAPGLLTPHDVEAMASYLGLDIVRESSLLWIARQAALSPLPSGWTEIRSSDDEVEGYRHMESNVISSKHPADDYFLSLVMRARQMLREQSNKPDSDLGSHADDAWMVFSDIEGHLYFHNFITGAQRDKRPHVSGVFEELLARDEAEILAVKLETESPPAASVQDQQPTPPSSEQEKSRSIEIPPPGEGKVPLSLDLSLPIPMSPPNLETPLETPSSLIAGTPSTKDDGLSCSKRRKAKRKTSRDEPTTVKSNNIISYRGEVALLMFCCVVSIWAFIAPSRSSVLVLIALWATARSVRSK